MICLAANSVIHYFTINIKFFPREKTFIVKKKTSDLSLIWLILLALYVKIRISILPFKSFTPISDILAGLMKSYP